MNKPKKTIEIITGDKTHGDVDPSKAVKGRSSRRAEPTEVGGHAGGEFMFECAWCGAVNYAEAPGEGGMYVCFACGRATRSSIA